MPNDRLVTSAATVPFFDLAPSHLGLKAELLAALSDLIDDGAFTNGPAVVEFERAFADYCGTSFAVGTASGLDALRLTLLAHGIERGDEVVVPAMTFVATLEAVTQAGGHPVVVDIGDSDWNMDPDAAAAALSKRTRYLLPVHLYGQLADLRALERICEEQGLALVEDACQAHGARRDGLRSGAVGFAGVFSFYPAKNLGAFGDAGALVTEDAELAAQIRALREHGQRDKYRHDVEGYTARLDTIQALVLLRKLPFLDEWNAQRRAAAAYYSDVLEGIGDLRLPPVPVGSEPVWHLYVVRTTEPEPLARFLSERGIGAGRHYPQPPHLTAAYGSLGYPRGAFPVAERLAEECLSLPLFPGIEEAQLEAVTETIADFFRG